MSGGRLEYSGNDRGGYSLDTGSLWEVGVDHSARTLTVCAGPDRLRIVDTYCGEWEMAERAAVHLNPSEARALGEILIAAAGETSWRSNQWRSNARQADPGPELRRLMKERIADADAIGEQAIEPSE